MRDATPDQATARSTGTRIVTPSTAPDAMKLDAVWTIRLPPAKAGVASVAPGSLAPTDGPGRCRGISLGSLASAAAALDVAAVKLLIPLIKDHH